MTPNQQKRYERDLRLWHYHQKNPDLTLRTLAEVFNLVAAKSVMEILRRMDKHLNHGEPYIKEVNYEGRIKKKASYDRPERVNIRTIKNDVAYLAKMNVRF